MKGWKNKKMPFTRGRTKFPASYAARVIDAAQKAQPGTVSHAVVKHDDWCDIFKGKPCNCNPDLEIISDEEYQKRGGDA